MGYTCGDHHDAARADFLDFDMGKSARVQANSHIRSDNGSEFTSMAVRSWLGGVGVKTLFIEPGIPWENGYIESFNGKLRDELLNVEIFDTLLEAKVLIERWRREYNTFRPHSSLGYRPPAPEAILPLAACSATLRSPPREEDESLTHRKARRIAKKRRAVPG